MRRRQRLAGPDHHEPPVPARDQVRRERLGGVLQRADEQRAQDVPVLERRLLDGRAAAPAADEMDEPVDVAVARGEVVRPAPRRRRVEQVDDVGVDRRLDLGGELVEALSVAPAHARPRAHLGEPL